MSSNLPPGAPERFPGRRPPQKPPTLLDWLRRPRNWITIGILIVLNYLIVNVLLAPQPPKQVTIPYNVFRAQIVANNVTSVTIQGDSITGNTKTAIGDTPTSKDKATRFATVKPSFGDNDLLPLMLEHNVTINANPENPPTPSWQTFLSLFG